MAALRLLTLVLTLSLPGAALLSLSMGSWGPVTALCFAAFVILLHVFFHGAIVLSAHGARPVEEYSLATGGSGALGLKPLVRRLAFRLGVPEPEVWMYVDVDARIFSVGTRYRQKMAVSSGLLAVLNAEELEAIVSRELLRFTHYRARRQPLHASLGCTFGRLFLPSREGWVMGRMLAISFLLPFFALLSRALRPQTKLTLAVDREAARILPDSTTLASALYKIAYQPDAASSLPLVARFSCGTLYPVPHREIRPFMELDFQERIGRLMGWREGSYAPR